MNPVIPPIKTESEGQVILNLHELQQGFVNVQIIMIEKDEWGINAVRLQDETRKIFYGKRTTALMHNRQKFDSWFKIISRLQPIG
jgi:hypothetical protein